jgi:hypothetical protein
VRVTNLHQALLDQGLTVVLVAGHESRGYEFPTRPPGKIRHWTAGPISGETPCLGVCTNGRTGLPGPLCNCYQSRRVDHNGLDVVYLVATGKANHAGEGSWNGHSGNYKFLGLEIEWAGPTEKFQGVRRREETSLRVMRAFHAVSSGSPFDACEHREYAPTRKIDTNLNGAAMRAALTTTPPGDDDMSAKAEAQIDDLHNIFAGRQPNNPGSTATRADTVLDNAMWTGNRLRDVKEIAERADRNAAAAALLAGNCNTMLDAIMKHLGIEIPEAPNP